MGLGWCDSANIGPEWFFHTDYSWLVLSALSNLLNLCITVIVALLLLPLGLFRYDEDPYIYVPERGPAVMYRAETNFNMIVTVIMGLLWGMRAVGLLSSDSPPIRVMRITWMSRVLSLLYVWAILWMSSLIWIQSNRQTYGRIVDIYER
jgi:quinol-cytochrome oxidoreductase complex cytochrome b subunit